MADRQSNVSSRNNQGNTSSADTILTTAGDILYRNNINQNRRLPIGAEDFQLTVSNGEAQWRRSTGELFKIGYCNQAASTFWNASTGESGVPFNQTSITRYNHANKIYTNWKYIENTGRVLTKSTSAQGGYTTANVTLLKGNCQELWATVNTDNANLGVILADLTGVGVTAISDCVDVVETDALAGIDILLDEPSSLTAGNVTDLNTWLGDLKTELNNSSASASLNLTLPAITNATIAGNYNFDYSTFAANVDTITINCCCQHNEFGYGTGNSPLECLIGGVYDDNDMCDDALDEQGQTTFYEGGVLQKYATDNSNNNMDKLVLKIPNDGFAHDDTQGAFTITSNLTKNKINYNATYATNTINGNRDSSGELRWFTGSYTMSFCDGASVRSKAEVIRRWLHAWEESNPTKTKPLYEILLSTMGGNCPDYYSM
jgi:hypothetical protein